jgi:hypothetical protein
VSERALFSRQNLVRENCCAINISRQNCGCAERDTPNFSRKIPVQKMHAVTPLKGGQCYMILANFDSQSSHKSKNSHYNFDFKKTAEKSAHRHLMMTTLL